MYLLDVTFPMQTSAKNKNAKYTQTTDPDYKYVDI